jgi:chloramphenicol 3-O-phosphotransferase
LYYFGINSLLTAHSNTIYTLAVNTTGGTPEEKEAKLGAKKLFI